MLVVWLPLRASSPETNRTTAGAYETRPLPKVTSTVVGRLLRNVTVRCPTERRVVGHPASVFLVTAFQFFVTVAWRVTRNATRLGCEAPPAVPATTARSPARTMTPSRLR